MMEKIFELVLKEARARPGDDLKIKALDVLFELHTRVHNAFESLPGSSCEFPSKDDKAA